MRITNQMVTDTALRNLQRTQATLDRLQGQLSSGRRMAQPSDDPSGTHLALGYRARLDATEQYLRTIDTSLAWVQATEVALEGTVNGLQRARELAVQAANDTLGPEAHAAIATEVQELVGHLVGLANTQLRGRYVFAGAQTATPPLVLGGGPPAVTYQGDSAVLMREIDVGETIAVNTAGTVFVGVIQGLLALREHLLASDTAAVRTVDLPALDAALQQVLLAQSEVGATTQRLEATRERHHEVRVHTLQQLSRIEDADFAEVASALAAQETVYKAALAANARAIQPSLFDYLR